MIRSGGLGRNGQFGRNRGLALHLAGEEIEASVPAGYEAKIAALGSMVGQVTLQKAAHVRLVNDTELSSIISGPKAAPSEADAK